MKKMNFLFVAPKVALAKEDASFPHGLAYVTAYMKSRGFNVHCLDLSFSDELVESQLQKKITAHKIDVVCTGGMSVDYHAINLVLEATKRINPELITVLGGAIVTSDPQLAIENMQADYGVLKEGEFTMADLADLLCHEGDPSTVTGLVFKDDQGHFVSTGERKAIENLDELPMPDYEGFQLERHLQKTKPNGSHFQMLDEVRVVNILTSRSCPFDCTFCYHPLGRVYRQRTMDNVFKEIDFLKEKYGINCIELMDELFSVKKERMLEFAKRITPYQIPWVAQLRVSDVNPELLSVLKASGLAWISYGIENVNDSILVSMKKKITLKQIEYALKITREAKIGFTGNILFGDPQETEESFDVSLEWWKKHPEYDLALCPIKTVPNSPLYRLALKKGLIKNKMEFMKSKFPIINLTSMSDWKFNRLLSKNARHEMDGRYKTRGKLLATRKIGVDEHGVNLYSITVQCPECGGIDIYNNYHQATVQQYFSIQCKQCLRRHWLPTLESFPDNYTFWQKAKFITAYKLKAYYLRVSFIRYYVEKIPFAKTAIMKFRKIALEDNH